MIIILGMAGSGKSTQGKMLAERKGWQWLSAGQILRDSGQFQEQVSQGILVDTSVIAELLIPEIQKYERAGQRVILDGFPRGEEQARWLVKHEELRSLIETVIYLEVPKDELRRRLLARGRMDDTEEAIERRLDGGETIIERIMQIMDESGVRTLRVDGTGTEEEVQGRLVGVGL